MDKIPKEAVKAGYDTDQSKMYVGRVIHEGNQLAVKVLKNHSGGYLSYRGQEIFVELLEVNFLNVTMRCEDIKLSNLPQFLGVMR